MLRSYVHATKLDNIDPTNTTHYLNLEDVYLGLGVSSQLELPEISDKQNILQEFKINCRKFFVSSCVGIRKRYSLNDPVLTVLSKLRPELCLPASADERLSTLSTLFNIMPRVSPKTLDKQQILDDEWRNFPLIATQIKDIQAVTEKPDLFWHKISELKDIDGKIKFNELSKFMLGVLSLPHSNAECECIFNQVNDIKTKKRNKLLIKSIKGNVFIQQSIKRSGKNCVDFRLTNDMLAKMNKSIYEKDTVMLEETDSE